MPGQFNGLTINGQNVTASLVETFTLPPTIQVTKLSDHELQAKVLVIVKKMFGMITVKQQFTVYYNADTGETKTTLS